MNRRPLRKHRIVAFETLESRQLMSRGEDVHPVWATAKHLQIMLRDPERVDGGMDKVALQLAHHPWAAARLGLGDLSSALRGHTRYASLHGWGESLAMILRTHRHYAAAHHLKHLISITATHAPTPAPTSPAVPISPTSAPVSSAIPITPAPAPVSPTPAPVTPTPAPISPGNPTAPPVVTTLDLPLSVAVGGTLDVTLPSLGLGGPDLAYVITPQPLPTNMTFNRGTGELTFTPAPDQAGGYTFDVAITNGSRSATVHVPLTVAGATAASTGLVGSVVDEAGQPLAGVPVMVGDLTTVTDSSGTFTVADLPTSPGPLTIDGFRDGTGGRMMFSTSIEQLLGHPVYANAANALAHPIILPRIDAENAFDFAQLDHSREIVATSPMMAGFGLHIDPGGAMAGDGTPFSGKLAITRVTANQARGMLPAGMVTDMIELDAVGLMLEAPVRVSVPNTDGLPAGAVTDLYAMNMTTGGNDLVGRLRVDPDGKTLTSVESVSFASAMSPMSEPSAESKGGIKAAAAPAGSSGSGGGGTGPTLAVCIFYGDKPPGPGTPVNPCNCPTTANGTAPGSNGGNGTVPVITKANGAILDSDADLNTGAYYQDHQLVAYQTQGQARGVGLEYSSLQASPYLVVQFEPSTQINSYSGNITTITAQATLGGVIQGSPVTYNTPGGLADATVYRVPLRVDATQLATGSYTYSITVTQNYNDARSLATTYKGFVDIVNRSGNAVGADPYGAGWSIGGVQQISLPDANGPALVTAGSMLAQRYDRVYNSGGKLKDLALVSLAGASSNNNTILANDGMAVFTAGAATATAASSGFVAGDFNGDGLTDLAEVAGTTLAILLGNASGKFTAGSTYTLPAAGASIVAGNFTGHANGVLDLAVLMNTVSGSTTTNKVGVLTGTGSGTFGAAVVSTVGTNQGWTNLVAGRFTGTTRTDLVAYAPGGSGVEILQSGTGSTVSAYAAVPLASPNTVTALAVVDANHDAKDDLVIAATPQYTGGTGFTSLDYFANAGTGTFASLTSTVQLDGVVTQGAPMVGGDFYGDGNVDIAAGVDGDIYMTITPLASSGIWGGEELYNGSLGDGTVGIDVPTGMVAGDFNGDGKDDLAFTNNNDGHVHLLLSNPDANQMQLMVETVNVPTSSLGLAAGAFTGHAAVPGYRSPMGETSTLVHNADGTWTRTYTDQTVVRFDTAGREVSETDRNGNVTSFGYVAGGAAAGALQTITDPVGKVTTLAYNASGKLATVTDPASRATTVTVDANGNLTKVIDPDAAITQYGYSTPSNHLMTTEVNPNNKTATAHYDSFGRLTSETLFDGTSTVGVAAAQEQGLLAPGGSGPLPTPATYVGTVTDADGHATALTFDDMGHPVVSVDALGNRTTITRDMNGYPVSDLDPMNRKVDYQYDMRGNVTQVTRYLAPGSGGGSTRPLTETIAYDPTFSEPVRITDFRGLTTTFTLDSRGNVTRRTDPDLGHEDWTYNAAGQVLTDTDRNGHTTSLAYDALGRLAAVTEPDAGAGIATITYGSDAAGNLTSVTDEVNDTTTFTYDQAGRVLTSQDPVQAAAGKLASFAYDPAGNLTSAKDALGHVTSLIYDSRNRLTGVVDPADQGTGRQYTYGYDPAGNLISVKDPLNHQTSFAYDALNRLTTVTDPLNHVTVSAYDADGEPTAVTDANGHAVSYSYDSLGRVQSMSLPGVGTAGGGSGSGSGSGSGGGSPPPVVYTFSYNDDDQLVSSTDPLNHATTSTYDNLGRRTAVTDALGHATSTGYDAVGNVTSVTDADGHVATATYDARNRLRTHIEPTGGGTTTYNYDQHNRIASLTDADSNVTSWGYDRADRPTTETDPRGKVTTTAYDVVGNVTQVTDRDGRVRQFGYDADNRETTERWMSGVTTLRTITIAYDAAGRVTDVQDPDSHYAYIYDSANRLLTVDDNGTASLPRVTLTYGYDPKGNRTSVDDSLGGLTSYTYDARDELATITQSGTGVAPKRVDFAYDAASRRTTLTRYSDLAGTTPVLATLYAYDAADRLTTLTHQTSGGVVRSQYAYTLDPANRLTSEARTWQNGTTQTDTLTYSYTNNDQLIGVTHTNTAFSNESYSYDATGNRTMSGYSTTTGNRLSNDGTFNYAYDDEGNLTSKTVIATGVQTLYTYDYRNRLTEVDTKSGITTTVVASYTYDALDRRIKVVENGTTTATLYEGNAAILDFNGSGVQVARYLQGPLVDEILARETSGGTVSWYLADREATIRDIATNAGSVVDHIDYDSYGNKKGETSPASGDRWEYAGREYDGAAGEYYNRARWFDPNIGRFTSQDPIGFGGGDANVYRYVANNITNFTDPSGLVGGEPTKPIPMTNPENDAPWYYDIWYGVMWIPNRLDQCTLSYPIKWLGGNNPYAKFMLLHSFQGSPDNFFFPTNDPFTQAILGSPEYAAGLRDVWKQIDDGKLSGTYRLNFTSSEDLHLAIGHADLNFWVTVDPDGKKHVRVQVTDRYVFENDYGIYYSTPKGWLINQWARTEQGCGAINPFSWWTQAVQYSYTEPINRRLAR